MPPTVDTLRIGETMDLRATPFNPDGTPGQLTGTSWYAANGTVVDVVGDSGDPYLAHVTGLLPLSTNVFFEGSDAYSGAHSEHVSVTVLNASRFLFSSGALVFEPDPDVAQLTGITVEAYPWDSRDDPNPPDYNALGSPGITDIVWSSANGAVLFGGPATGSPAGTATATGTLKVEIWPDTTSGTSEQTTDVVTLTAKNSDGQTITGTLAVTIRRVTTIEIEVVET